MRHKLHHLAQQASQLTGRQSPHKTERNAKLVISLVIIVCCERLGLHMHYNVMCNRCLHRRIGLVIALLELAFMLKQNGALRLSPSFLASQLRWVEGGSHCITVVVSVAAINSGAYVIFVQILNTTVLQKRLVQRNCICFLPQKDKYVKTNSHNTATDRCKHICFILNRHVTTVHFLPRN